MSGTDLVIIDPRRWVPSTSTETDQKFPIARLVSDLSAGMLTFLVTPSSANFAAAVTDETGTNKIVFSDSPTLATPTATTTITLTGTGANPNVRVLDGTLIVKLQGLSSAIGLVGTESNHPFAVYIGNTERVRFDTAGNVGIGTASPARLLHVAGRHQLGGTAEATTDWALTSGWGASATISAVTGTDSRGTVTVQTNALDTPSLNPVITLTFKDGTWTTVPFAMANMNSASTGVLGAASCKATATTLVITYDGTPTALTAATYIFNYFVVG